MARHISIAEFRAFRDCLRQVCGLNLPDGKFPQVASIVGTRMVELGLDGFSDYRRLLSSSAQGPQELSALATLLTVGETYFYRNKDHWRALRECVLPWILERNEATPQRRIRLWSAGCSTGEEAYTMAMVLAQSCPGLRGVPIEIIGTDINPVAVDAARRALYTENSFRSVPAEVRQKYFEPAQHGLYRPRAEIRDTVRFQELNLLDQVAVSRMQQFDVVFCRNVLIYFDVKGRQTVFNHFHGSLKPGGYLVLGHAESMSGGSSSFATINVCDTFLYKSVPRPAESTKASKTVPTGTRSAVPKTGPDSFLNAGSETSGTLASPRGRVLPVRKTAHPSANETQSAKPPAARDLPSLDDLRDRAIAHLCDKRNAEAQRNFEQILQREPNDVGSLLGMALLLANNGSSEAALEGCQQVLDSDPMSSDAYGVMALVHEGLGDEATAQRELEKAIYLDDTFSIAHFRLAGLYERSGRKEAVARELHNTLCALSADDEIRVRLYSGGFDKETIARLCEQRLGHSLKSRAF
jgi:chemotaxis protein methyltransferase CheR